jgi:hypothetical protein
MRSFVENPILVIVDAMRLLTVTASDSYYIITKVTSQRNLCSSFTSGGGVKENGGCGAYVK